ncbi:MAG: hypothetical protein VZR00_02535 [Lachnospiraceae bacterium]|jgi:hypothetical protein|nr:hypothetical protein [Lachnospiraceae bacterium]MEE3460753.1 hypothetical protein [Lachnospiraceae bacterium]
MNKLIYGNLLLFACCIFYLVWWILAFDPKGRWSLTWPWLIVTAAFGFAGIWQCISGIGLNTPAKKLFGLMPVGIGILVYAALLFITYFFMHRIVTTELFLIVGWTILQIMVLDTAQAFYGAGGISRTAFAVLLIIAIVIAAVSLAAYLKYYDLPKLQGYIDGMIPLILMGVFMAAEAVCMKG